MIGAKARSFSPTTTTTKSVARESERIAAERNVALEGAWPAVAGGHGNKALSLPMREELPAARITPAKLGARVTIAFRDQKSRLTRGPRRWHFRRCFFPLANFSSYTNLCAGMLCL